jgi:hypothetical protein
VSASEGVLTLHAWRDGDGTPSRREVRSPLSPAHVHLSWELLAVEDAQGSLCVWSLAERDLDRPITTCTEPYAGERPAAAVGAHLYRIARGQLLRGRVHPEGLDEEPVAEVLPGQTWIAARSHAAEGDLVVAVTRVLGERHATFLTRQRRTELVLSDLHAAARGERACLGDASVALSRAFESPTGRVEKVELFALDGGFQGAFALPSSSGSVLAGALVGPSGLLAASASGLARLRPNAEALAFAGTAGLVTDGSLLASLGNSLAVATQGAVRALRLG